MPPIPAALIKTPDHRWFCTTSVFWTGDLSNVVAKGSIVRFLVEHISMSAHPPPWFCMPRSDGDLTETHIFNEIQPYGGTMEDVQTGRVLVATVAQRFPIFQRPDVQARCVLLMPQDDHLFETDVDTVLAPLRTIPWEQRVPRVFWRGACSADYKNNEFLRLAVVAALADHPACDVKLVRRWHEDKPIPESYFADPCPLVHFLSHRILLILDGNGISSSHTWVFGSGAVPLLISNCDFWFRPLLVPYEHYVPVQYDLSDLREKIDWVLAHDADAQRIAEGAMAFARAHLSAPSQQKYLRNRVIECLNAVQL